LLRRDQQDAPPVQRRMMPIGTKTAGPVNCQLASRSNMAVGAHVFKSGVRFDPRFGPDGSEVYPMGSEPN